ncbi:hypothetical protein SH449x_000578 [Pirellulaceae bacterium SH449]
MRLTLRTLLAYRDGVLDSKDAALLESKLRDSSTAQQISQRIDDGMANPRLAPIPVDAKEFGFDANHIAEYLDDTIAVDQIPAMERCCLENNALLSEVGSCHRVLTKALAAPVDIPWELRDRILALPAAPSVKPSRLKILRLGKDGSTVRFDAPTVAKYDAVRHNPTVVQQDRVQQDRVQQDTIKQEAVPAHGEPAISSVVDNNQLPAVRPSPSEPRGSGIELNEGLGHQVPEYLIGQDRSWLKNAAAVVMLVCALVLVAFLAIGPLERLQSMLGEEYSTVDVKPPRPSAENLSSDNKSRQPSIEKDAGIAGQKPSSTETVGSREETLPSVAAAGSIEKPVSGKEGGTADNSASGASEAGSSEAASGAAPAAIAGEADKVITENDVAKSQPPSAASTAGSNGASSDASPAGPAVKWLPETKESSQSLVFYRNPLDPSLAWQKIELGFSTAMGDIVVPPHQRTEFVTLGGIRIVVCDAAQLEFQAKSTSMAYGRALLFPTPDGRSFELETPTGLCRIEFADLSSSCAIEIRHNWGENTREDLIQGNLKTVCSVTLFGIQGVSSVSWRASEVVQQEELQVGDELQLLESGAASKSDMTAAPNWFRTSVERSIDQFAVQDANKVFGRSNEKSASELLVELSQSKRAETASLATRILCQFGRFDGLLGSNGFIARKGSYTHLQTWLPELVNVLGEASMRSKFFEAAKESLESRTVDVLRLLVTHSTRQMREGGERLLIESLSSNQQDERLLAIVQLNQLTGKTLGFHPEKNSTDAIQQWRKTLAKEESRSSQSN